MNQYHTTRVESLLVVQILVISQEIFGGVENNGIEFMITGVPIDTKDITWNVNLNFSSDNNKVTDLGK